MHSYSIKSAICILLAVSACNRPPKQMYNIPPEYSLDYVIDIYNCQNGQAAVDGPDGLEIQVPPNGINLHSLPRTATRDSYQRLQVDGTITAISASEVEVGVGVELIQSGAMPVPCSYSYILLDKSISDSLLSQNIKSACQQCESANALNL